MKSIDSNDVTETIVRQASGKDSVLTFSRAGDNPTQWFQLLNALDQPDLPGWPLLIPQKVQMQKCEKCSREFCAPINYRRHVRIHRRSLNVDKDSHKIRDVLAAFWDKLSLEKAKEVVSFHDVSLKDVSGYTVIKAWASSIHKPGTWTLPQDYVTSGSTLSEVINAKPSRLPISSQELFYILDDASEKTFLCAGTAESVQKYLFDGEVRKVALELRNMVACISFLFERNLVKAWLADKDAEALRCQKLLMEEEEAVQKRQDVMSERKKQRKLRQKEQKEKEQLHIIVNVNSLEQSLVVETSTQSTLSGSNSDTPDIVSIDEPIPSLKTEQYINGSGTQMVDSTLVEESSFVRRRWRVPKSQRNRRNGFLQESQQQQNLQLVHVEPCSQKVWTKKFRIENDEDNNKHSNISEDGAVTVSRHQPDANNRELIIGSITVSLPVKNHVIHKKDVGLRNKLKKNDDIKQIHSSDNVQSTGIRRQWRPLSNGHEARAQLPVTRVQRDSENVEVEKLDDDDEDGNQSKNDSSKERKGKEFLSSLGDVTSLATGGVDFSSVDARAFLAERWKKAVSTDHVKLVISRV